MCAFSCRLDRTFVCMQCVSFTRTYKPETNTLRGYVLVARVTASRRSGGQRAPRSKGGLRDSSSDSDNSQTATNISRHPAPTPFYGVRETVRSHPKAFFVAGHREISETACQASIDSVRGRADLWSTHDIDGPGLPSWLRASGP